MNTNTEHKQTELLAFSIWAAGFQGVHPDQLAEDWISFQAQAPKLYEARMIQARSHLKILETQVWEGLTSDALRTEPEYAGALMARFQDPQMIRLLHAAMGMCTEAAEFLDMLKKHFFYGKAFDRVNAIEEIGDSTWYERIGCSALSIMYLEMIRRNVNKLRQRFPEKFTEADAINRNVVEELKHIADPQPGPDVRSAMATVRGDPSMLAKHDYIATTVPGRNYCERCGLGPDADVHKCRCSEILPDGHHFGTCKNYDAHEAAAQKMYFHGPLIGRLSSRESNITSEPKAEITTPLHQLVLVMLRALEDAETNFEMVVLTLAGGDHPQTDKVGTASIAAQTGLKQVKAALETVRA